MPATLLHNVAVQNQNQGADGLFTHELGVNPLSVILIALRPLNETSTITNFVSYLAVCDAINRVSLLHRGQSIISMTGRDAAAMAYFRHGIEPWQNNHDDVDNDRRCVVLPLLLGRRAYDVNSAFPASRSGELILELDLDDADTGYDDLQYTVEIIELLGAKPTEFERKVQLTRTNAATGINDLDMPVGNRLRGALAFGTTAFVGGAPAPSWGRMSMVIDGVEIGYSSTDFEVAHMLPALLGRQAPRFDASTTRVDASSVSTTEETIGTNVQEIGSGGWQNYAYLDLDPLMNDELSLDLSGVSRCQLRADVETADAVRLIPVEQIRLSQA